jgi:flagellar assembly protein FliH
LSDAGSKSSAGAQLWQAPDMGPVARKMATAGGLADLQAEAHKEAFEQGLAEGREAGRAEVRAQVERLSGMFFDLAKPFEVLDAEVERELLTLAMALAQQIVRRELKSDPTQIIGIIREAIAALPVAAREVRVHLHPEDAAVVRQHLAPTENERAWRYLTTGEQLAILHCYQLDLTHEETAYVLGIPAGTVKTNLARGKAKLRTQLEGWNLND